MGEDEKEEGRQRRWDELEEVWRALDFLEEEFKGKEEEERVLAVDWLDPIRHVAHLRESEEPWRGVACNLTLVRRFY